jgi:hypothetical protein
MPECDCIDHDGMRPIKCPNTAAWGGENSEGSEVVACDDHRHLFAFGTMYPLSDNDDRGTEA